MPESMPPDVPGRGEIAASIEKNTLLGRAATLEDVGNVAALVASDVDEQEQHRERDDRRAGDEKHGGDLPETCIARPRVRAHILRPLARDLVPLHAHDFPGRPFRSMDE